MNIRKETMAILLFSLVFLLVLPNANAQILTVGEVRTKDEQGSPVYLDETVTVQGIVAVDSGLWHDSANYFAIIDQASLCEGVLVYLPGTTQPAVQGGSLVQVTGQLGNRGYATDVGSLVILVTDPENVKTLEPNYGLTFNPEPIATDASEDILNAVEGGFVQIEGRLFDYSNSGIVRGFWLDGSQNGNFDDGQGAIYFKFYNYAGLDISDLHNGSYVVATGILLKADERHGGYYIRPVNGDSITEISEKSVSAEFYGPQGLSFELGTPQQIREYGLIELVSLQTSLPLDREAYPEWNPDGGSLIATLGIEQGARITREAAERNLFQHNTSGNTPPNQLTFEYYPHAYPRWSPDGKHLVYAAAPNLDHEGNWDIYFWDLENEFVQLTNHPSYDITPTWSPEGESIIFSSNRNGKWDLWWQSLDSEEAIQLTSGPADVLFPDWGTTGLVFQRRGSAGRFELWRAEIVMDNGRPILGNEICLTADLDGSNVYPRWSPKGDRIAFMSSGSGQWDLWIMDREGANKERLTKFPGNYLFPTWHPNGRRLACVAELASAESPSLYMLDIAGASKAKYPMADVEGEVGVVGSELAPNSLNGPINNVTWPLLTQPALVSPGSELSVFVRNVPEENLSVILQSANFAYEFSGSQVDGKLTFLLPDDLPVGLYDLVLSSATVRDEQPRAVSVMEPRSGNITFALVTDIHPELSYRDENNKLLPVIRELNERELDFVVFSGDLVGKSADNYQQDYPDLYNLLKTEAEFPFFMVMGNHDGKVSGSIDGFSYWQSYFGELYYTFDVDQWRFVAINTYDHPDYPSENGFIKEEQLGWLENQLGLAQTNQKSTIAFLHHNPFDTRWRFIDEGQGRLRDLLETYGVSHVFAGHRHSDQLEQTITSTIVTTQWVEPESGNRGYRVVTIEGNHVKELQR